LRSMSDMADEDRKSDQPAEKPLNDLLSRQMVDIYVGEENTHWILHEKLLCYYSPYFRSIFYNKKSNDKSIGLPEDEDTPFELFVGWLYSRALRLPTEEKDVGPLLDLYLMSERFQMEKLSYDVVDTVRNFYHSQNSYPGLRRVQYVYTNTGDDNAMREMMVSSVARFLTLGDSIPAHWDRALRKNGQLAVDIIRAIQEWHLESRSVPDARDGSVDKNGKFASVEPDDGNSSMMSYGRLKNESD